MIQPTPSQIAYWQTHADDSKKASIIIANMICIIGAYIAVALRFASRRLARASIQSDDWAMVAGLLFATMYVIGYSITTHYGLGGHIIFVTNAKGFFLSVTITELLYNIAIPTIKISILFLYHRIFPQTWFRHVLISTGVFVLSYSIAAWFCDIFQCVPIESAWDPTTTGKCIYFPTVILTTGIINILSDVFILVLPMPLLWRLKVSTNRKWLLSATFLMGGFVCIISIIRLLYIQNVAVTADPSWDDVDSATLSTVEICVGVLSACLPTYRPLYKFARHGPTATETSHGRTPFRSKYNTHEIYDKTEVELSTSRSPRTTFMAGSSIIKDEGNYQRLEPAYVGV